MLNGCSKEETISFHTFAPEVNAAVFEKIDKESIWYKKLNNDRYEFRVKDIQRIRQIYGEEANKIRPFDRSTYYHPDILSKIIIKLDKNNIPYQVRQFEGEDWLVWEENNNYQVQEIAKEATTELSK